MGEVDAASSEFRIRFRIRDDLAEAIDDLQVYGDLSIEVGEAHILECTYVGENGTKVTHSWLEGCDLASLLGDLMRALPALLVERRTVVIKDPDEVDYLRLSCVGNRVTVVYASESDQETTGLSGFRCCYAGVQFSVDASAFLAEVLRAAQGFLDEAQLRGWKPGYLGGLAARQQRCWGESERIPKGIPGASGDRIPNKECAVTVPRPPRGLRVHAASP